jgi:hypothetical protein
MLNDSSRSTLREYDQASGSRWQPHWVFTAAVGYTVGLTVDDHCFVVLVADQNDQWRPAYHIPQLVAEEIGRLAAGGALNP